jgi:hypothetical protein
MRHNHSSLIAAIALLASSALACTAGDPHPCDGVASCRPQEWPEPEPGPAPRPAPRGVLKVSQDQELPITEIGARSEQQLTLENIGDATLRLKSITLVGDSAFSLEDAPASWTALSPGERAELRLAYRPTGSGTRSATLIIEHDASNTPFTMNIRAKAQSRMCIEATPLIDFGLVDQGQRAEQLVELRNCTGDRQLLLRSLRITGDAEDFALLLDPLSSEVSAGITEPIQIAPKTSALFKLRYTANPARTMPGATLELAHSWGELQIPIRATTHTYTCPTALLSASTLRMGADTRHVFVGEPFALSGAASQPAPQHDAPLDYTWELRSKPEGSTLELPDTGVAQLNGLVADLPGKYLFAMRLAQGEAEECAPVTIEINAQENTSSLRVELEWEGSPDGDADLDLHYAEGRAPAWEMVGEDVFEQSRVGSWGLDGTPTLTRVEATSEQLDHYDPKGLGRYSLGVHYKRDGGAGPRVVRLRIYRGDALIYTNPEVTLEEGEFLLVGELPWRSVSQSIKNTITQGFPQP